MQLVAFGFNMGFVHTHTHPEPKGAVERLLQEISNNISGNALHVGGHAVREGRGAVREEIEYHGGQGGPGHETGRERDKVRPIELN